MYFKDLTNYQNRSRCRLSLRLARVSQDIIFFRWALLNADRTASRRFVYAESALHFWTFHKRFQGLSGRLQAKRLYSFESEGTELVCDDDCVLSASPAALTRLCMLQQQTAIKPCRCLISLWSSQYIYETLSSTSCPEWCILTPKMQTYQIMHHHVERTNKWYLKSMKMSFQLL